MDAAPPGAVVVAAAAPVLSSPNVRLAGADSSDVADRRLVLAAEVEAAIEVPVVRPASCPKVSLITDLMTCNTYRRCGQAIRRGGSFTHPELKDVGPCHRLLQTCLPEVDVAS
jgi:hypothetical protein